MKKIEKKSAIYVLHSESDIKLSVQETVPTLDGQSLEPEVIFLLENVRPEDLNDACVVFPISKAETKELIKALTSLL